MKKWKRIMAVVLAVLMVATSVDMTSFMSIASGNITSNADLENAFEDTYLEETEEPQESETEAEEAEEPQEDEAEEAQEDEAEAETEETEEAQEDEAEAETEETEEAQEDEVEAETEETEETEEAQEGEVEAETEETEEAQEGEAEAETEETEEAQEDEAEAEEPQKDEEIVEKPQNEKKIEEKPQEIINTPIKSVKKTAKNIALQEVEQTYAVQGEAGNTDIQLKWITYILPSETPRISLTLYYKQSTEERVSVFANVDTEGKLTITDIAKSALGLTEEQISQIQTNITVKKESTGAGIDTYSVTGLPNELVSITSTEGGNETSTKIADITYSLGQDEEKRLVTSAQKTYFVYKNGEGLDVIPTIEFNAEIDIRSGGLFPLLESDITSSFTLIKGAETYSFGANNKIYSNTNNQVLPYAEWEIQRGQQSDKLIIYNLTEYTTGKELIDWQLSADEDAYKENKRLEDPTDYFYDSYNNSSVPNYGSDRSVCHNGGKVALVLSGHTQYSATKEWLDIYTGSDNNEAKQNNRPQTEWALWRYSNRVGTNWNQASPVRDDELQLVKWDIDVTQDTSTYTTVGYQVGTDGENAKELSLPKYDSDGYPYIYFVREAMVGAYQYEEVFGSVGSDGITTGDVYPGESRDPKDRSLYNEGTLSNRRAESQELEVTKTWETAAYQGGLDNVCVELTLQYQKDDGSWHDTKYKTYLKGFTAENLTREEVVTVPVYDEFGKPYTFRWTETGVYEGDPRVTENLENKYNKETQETILSDNTKIRGDREYYTTEVDEENSKITNRLHGYTSYLIKKTWEGGLTKKEEDSASITWTLLRDGAEFAEQYTDVVMNKDNNWEVVIENLPKYNPTTGAEYQYMAIETSCNLEGWMLGNYNYNEEMTMSLANGETITRRNNTVEIVNGKTTGGHVIIKVRKQWVDGNDIGCRKEVLVNVIRDAYGNHPAKVVATNIALNYENNWWQKVIVTEFRLNNGTLGTYAEWRDENPGGVWSNDDVVTDATYRLVEVGLKNGEVYNTPYMDMALRQVDRNPEDNRYIGNNNHIYYIDYPDNGKQAAEDEYFDVVNRRVGIINVKVKKTWIDGHNSGGEAKGGVSEETRKNYGTKLTLSCDEYPDAVNPENPTKVALHGESSVVGTVRDIKDANGNDVSYEQNIGQQLDGEGKEYIYFYNLPKYDENGKVVHYTVTETSKDDILTTRDYIVIEEEKYTAGASHTNDEQDISITNKRQTTKSVTFYKQWKDEYRVSSRQRPDIFLTLYAASRTNGVQPTEYRNIIWAEKAESRGAVPKNVDMTFGKYNWSCTFTGLPKYNELGEEIFYFASESMHVDRYKLEYLDTQYRWNNYEFSEVVYAEATEGSDEEGKYVAKLKEEYENNANAVVDGKLVHYYLINDSRYGIILREEGTFINELQNTVCINGTKIWKNVPGSFEIEDLPKIRISAWKALEANVESNKDAYYDDKGLPKAGMWEEAAYIEELVSSGFNTLFELNFAGKNNQDGTSASEDAERLKQFDEYGSRYIYTVTETLLSGGEQIQGSYEADPEMDGYQITNVYNPVINQGSITVGKEWEFPPEWDGKEIDYPELTFTLYWRYIGEDGKYSDVAKVDIDGVVNTKKLQYSENNTKVTFENLPIKAANGSAYEYFVVESGVNGYDQSSDKKASAEVVAEIKNLTAKTDITVSGPLVPQPSPESGSQKASANVQTTFKNIYRAPQYSFAIKGGKVWNDYRNIFGTRPESLKIEVWRKTVRNAEEKLLTAELKPNGTGVVVNPNISLENTENLAVSCEKDSTTTNWKYTIRGLDQYASNGNIWQYKVVEIVEDEGNSLIGEYDAAKKETGYITAPVETVEDGGGHIILVDKELPANQYLTNNLYTQHTVKKEWAGIYSNIAKLPVTVKLQVKAGANGTWADADKYFSGNKAIEYVISGDTEPWTETLAVGSNYSYTWKNLPKGEKVNDVFVPYEYRAIETAVGNETITFTGNGDTQTYKATDLFTITSSTIGNVTTITNTLTTDGCVGLTVTKTWDDFNNQYNLRPMDGTNWSVTFEIWRKVIDAAEGVAGEVVKAANGTSNLTINITGDGKADSNSVTITELPKRTKNADGSYTTWIYYAKEIFKNGSVLDTGYGQTEILVGTSPDCTFETWNTLQTVDITGTKVWEDVGVTAFRPENVELTLYLSEDSGSTWKKASDANAGYAGVTASWSDTDSDTWTWKYEKLPVTNAAGTALKYKVVETVVDGYWNPTYANAGTTVDYLDSNQITNEITKFTLDKVGSSEIGAITDVSLTFEGTGTAAGWKLVWNRVAGKENYTIYKNDVKVHSDESNGTVVIKGLPVGTYMLTEEVVPYGYETAAGKDYSVTLNASGTINVIGTPMSTSGTISGNNLKATVTNTPQSLTVKKTDLSGKELSGAVFEITGCFRASDTAMTESTTKEIGGTVADKQLKAGDLVAGQTYTLKEIVAPAGYILSDTVVTFTMDTDGKVQGLSQNPTTAINVDANAANGKDTIIFKDDPIKIVLRKTKDINVTDDSANIDGAKFELAEFNSEAASESEQWTVLSEVAVTGGKIELNGATHGLKINTSYRLTETKAADGYILNTSPIYFRIDSAGRLNETTAGTTDVTEIEVSIAETEIKVQNEPISATLTKVDGDLRTGETLNLGYAGVTFTLVNKANASDTQTVTTDATGKLTFGPDAGPHCFKVVGNQTYTLSETVPTGYTGIPATEIKVNADGTIRFTEIKTAGSPTITGGNGGNQITVTNRRIPGTLNIQKVDLYDNTQELDGAVFELRYKDVIGKNAGDVAQRKTTGTDGKITFENVEWGVYELVEVTAPEGYILDSDVQKRTFEVEFTNEKTSVSMMVADGRAITNCKNSLAIYKTDGADKKLQATFELYAKVDSTTWELLNLPAYSADCISISGLKAGTYKLVEKIPPTGYRIPAKAADGELIFKMKENGKITTSGTISSYYTVSNGTANQNGVYPNTITMKDDLTQAIIKKVDQDGNALTGATFEITGKFVSTPEGSTSSKITVTDDNRETALKGELIADETYQIKEINAPMGYKKPEEANAHFTLTVNKNGTYIVSGATGAVLNGTTIEVPANTVDTVWIKDEPIDITLTKRDADFQKGEKETLANVKFTLREKGNEDASKIQTAITDKDGKLKLGLASENSFDVYACRTYILKEVEAPAGYIIGLPESGVELTVNANGTVTFTEIENVISGNATSAITVVNERETGTLILTKKDSHSTEDKSDDTALNGITFSLYRKQDGNWLEKFVNFITGNSYILTDSFVWGQEETYPSGAATEDGKIMITGLIWGNYKIVESKADGYVLDGSEHEFSIGPDSELKQYLEVSLGEIINDPNYVVVKKVDKTNNRRLAGAVFTLKDSNGKRVKDIQWSWNSDKGEGKAYRLAPGTYTLTETKAPDGYVKMQPVQFRMNADGTIDLLDENDLTVLMNGDTVGVILKNKRKLHKVEEETQTDGSDSSYAANTESAKTGDQAPIAGLLVVMGAAVIGFVSVKLFKKRKQK